MKRGRVRRGLGLALLALVAVAVVMALIPLPALTLRRAPSPIDGTDPALPWLQVSWIWPKLLSEAARLAGEEGGMESAVAETAASVLALPAASIAAIA